jgi:penicillin-binding protein 1A
MAGRFWERENKNKEIPLAKHERQNARRGFLAKISVLVCIVIVFAVLFQPTFTDAWFTDKENLPASSCDIPVPEADTGTLGIDVNEGEEDSGDNTGEENGGGTGEENGGGTGEENGGGTGEENGGGTGEENGGGTGDENGGGTCEENGGETGEENDGETGEENDGETGEENDGEPGEQA